MNETISTTIARPESLTPVGGIIAIASSEILHQQGLYSHSKLLNADFTCIDHDVVIVVVGSNIGKLLDVSTVCRSDTCNTAQLNVTCRI
jgi:hypothetical protein